MIDEKRFNGYLMVKRWTSAMSPSSGKSMHLIRVFAKLAAAFSISSDRIVFKLANLDSRIIDNK